jgi:hypothetical protein
MNSPINKFSRYFTGLVVLLLLVFDMGTAAAQGDQGLTLRMARNFGYSQGNEAQGTFTLKATGPADLQKVVFYIDQEMLGEDTQAPFELRFNTDSHPLGQHVLHATGTTASGATLESNQFTAVFVTAQEGWQAGLKIAAPILAITFGLLLLTLVSSFIGSGKLKSLPPGTPRSYGVSGGAICSRCGRPFPRHFFSPNMVFGKLERCPYCGHWGIAVARPIDQLRAAEAAEVADAQAGALEQTEDETERLRKQLDDSRYRD